MDLESQGIERVSELLGEVFVMLNFSFFFFLEIEQEQVSLWGRERLEATIQAIET